MENVKIGTELENTVNLVTLDFSFKL
jgi:hypothetical protein